MPLLPKGVVWGQPRVGWRRQHSGTQVEQFGPRPCQGCSWVWSFLGPGRAPRVSQVGWGPEAWLVVFFLRKVFSLLCSKSPYRDLCIRPLAAQGWPKAAPLGTPPQRSAPSAARVRISTSPGFESFCQGL